MKELKDLKLKQKSELKSLDAIKMKEEVVRVEKEYFVLRMKKNVGELKQAHLMKSLRRYAAMVRTLASEKWFKIG